VTGCRNKSIADWCAVRRVTTELRSPTSVIEPKPCCIILEKTAGCFVTQSAHFFMKPEGSSPYSQQPDNKSYLEPDESIPHSCIIFF
jgi:hypothetical protein